METDPNRTPGLPPDPIIIAIPIDDAVTATDAIGPYEILRAVPGVVIKFVSEVPGPKRADTRMLTLVADYAYADVPRPDIVVVPAADFRRSLENGSLTGWLQTAHETSLWTTSVCGGSLTLAAAGLLRGKRATTHWAAMEQLRAYGAIPCPDDRWVVDGKVVTAAGVSAGLDMALWLAAQLAGDLVAQGIQLGIEYDPQPPFDAGSLAKAPPAVVAWTRAWTEQAVPS